MSTIRAAYPVDTLSRLEKRAVASSVVRPLAAARACSCIDRAAEGEAYEDRT